VEPSRIKVMLVTDDGGAITLVASERGLAPVVARLREQGWRLVDADDSAAPGRFRSRRPRCAGSRTSRLASVDPSRDLGRPRGSRRRDAERLRLIR
jgi:hypothetical protein